MKNFKRLFIIVLVPLLNSCVSIKPPTFLQSDYEKNTVEKIGILEVKWKGSTNQEDQISEKDLKKVQNIVAEKVLDRKYNVPVVFQYENVGLESERDLTIDKIIEICKSENVNALLYSSISEYSDAYLGEHKLAMNFYLFKENGDSIWIDEVNLNKNGLLAFLGLVAGVTVATAVQPDDGIVPQSTKIQFGLGIGVLAGLAAEGLIPYISSAISERFQTLPKGSGQGKRLK